MAKQDKSQKRRYRLIVRNDESFEERFSVRVSKLRIVFLLLLGSLFWIALMSILFIYSPLNNYINNDEKHLLLTEQALKLQVQIDSLNKTLAQNDFFIRNVKQIIQGKVPEDNISHSPLQEDSSSISYDSITDTRSKDDSLLRLEMENANRFGVYYEEGEDPYQTQFQNRPTVFFAPIKGFVTNYFNPNTAHFGLDIVAKKDTPIKNIADGVVLLAQWTIDNGFVILIQHANNTVSVYKHNASLFKQEGDYVKAGDLIAIIGNSGHQSTGTHLHFELWINGVAVNPMEYISFE